MSVRYLGSVFAVGVSTTLIAWKNVSSDELTALLAHLISRRFFLSFSASVRLLFGFAWAFDILEPSVLVLFRAVGKRFAALVLWLKMFWSAGTNDAFL